MIAVLSNKCDRRGVTRTLLLAALFLGVFVLVPVAMLRAGDEKKTDAQKPPAADSPSSNPKPAGNVDIPQSDAAANETVTVDVAEDGSLSLNGKAVSLKSLSNEVASLGGNPNPHIDVHVAAGAPFNRVVEVFDELEKVGGGITIRTPGKTGVSRVPGIRRDRDAEPADVVRQKRLRSEAQRDKAKRESDLVRIEDERARVDAVQADVARLKLRQAEAQLRRMERLSADNLISNSELDAAKLEVGRWKAASVLDSKEKWKAEVELAEAEVALNEANLKRMAELFDQKLVAESEMEMAKAESAIAKAKLRGAMARFRSADSAKAVDADTRPGPAANPAKKERLLQILDDEIKVASDQAKLVRDQRRQGLASTEALFRAELDVMALQRERASLEGEPAKVKELIGQQIGVLQELERVTREQRQQGAENESEVLKVRRQILMLQRQQAQMDF